MAAIDVEQERGVLAALSDELAGTVDRAARAVVTVDGRERMPATGVVWGDATTVVTAAHVLERTAAIRVTSGDGATVNATLVGRDLGADVALLRLASPAPVVAEVAPPEASRAGGFVLAIGRPEPGGLPQASFGVISAVGASDRQWRTARGGVVQGYVRADVALLPGFSGGPLVDAQGRVIGLISSHLAGSEAIGLPAALVGALVEDLRAGRGGTSSRRGYLGISSQVVQLQGALRSRLGVDQELALMVVGLERGSPAHLGGILPGDIVLAVDGRSITDGEALLMALGPSTVGRQIVVRLLRGGQVRELPVTPVERSV